MKPKTCKEKGCATAISPFSTSGLCPRHQSLARYHRKQYRAVEERLAVDREHLQALAKVRREAMARYQAELAARGSMPSMQGRLCGQVEDRHALRRGPSTRYDYTEFRR